MSTRPNEILNLKAKDIEFNVTNDEDNYEFAKSARRFTKSWIVIGFLR
jgi:hypothetical protein